MTTAINAIEELEHDIASYEKARYGTDSVEEFLKARQPSTGKREPTREILETAFFKSRSVSGMRSLNHFDSVFAVDSSHGTYVAKFCLPTRNEVLINNILMDRDAGVSAECVAVENDTLAIFAKYDTYLPEKELFPNIDAQTEKISSLGTLLSRIHRILLTAEIPAWKPKVNVERFFEIGMNELVQLPGIDIQTYIEALQALRTRLHYLRRVAPTCFIHGDFKIDNIVEKDARPVAIDWETAGRGHREADLGVFIGCIISLWLQEKAKSYEGDFDRILSSGDVSTRQAVMTIACFLDAYRDGAAAKIDLRLLGLYVGIFLLNRAYVSNMLNGRFDLESLLSFKLGQAVVRKPIKFIRLCNRLIENR